MYRKHAILTKPGMLPVCGGNSRELQENVKKAMEQIQIADGRRKDMVYDKFDDSIIEA